MLQEGLGDIVYAQLPDVDAEFKQFGKVFIMFPDIMSTMLSLAMLKLKQCNEEIGIFSGTDSYAG